MHRFVLKILVCRVRECEQNKKRRSNRRTTIRVLVESHTHQYNRESTKKNGMSKQRLRVEFVAARQDDSAKHKLTRSVHVRLLVIILIECV